MYASGGGSPRPHRFARVAIVVLAAMAIILGPVAMHTPTSLGGGQSSAAAAILNVSPAVAVGHQVHAAPAQALNECGGSCAPVDNILGMACLLVLLVTALAAVVRVALMRSSVTPTKRRLLIPGSARWRLMPPSLLILSISRT